MSPIKGALISPITKAIVAYLEKHGPSRLADIDRELMKIDGYCTNDDPTRPSRTLNKMRMQGHIHRILRNDEMLWVYGPQPQPQAVDPVPDADSEADPDSPAVVQSPNFDRMRAPSYVPEQAPALRPGALDYKRCPTVGLRC